MKFPSGPTLFLLSMAMSASVMAEDCEILDRETTHTVADGEYFETEPYCMHRFEPEEENPTPSSIATYRYYCNNGTLAKTEEDWPDTSLGMQEKPCPDKKPECYDLDQYTDPVNYVPKCVEVTTDDSAGFDPYPQGYKTVSVLLGLAWSVCSIV